MGFILKKIVIIFVRNVLKNIFINYSIWSIDNKIINFIIFNRKIKNNIKKKIKILQIKNQYILIFQLMNIKIIAY